MKKLKWVKDGNIFVAKTKHFEFVIEKNYFSIIALKEIVYDCFFGERKEKKLDFINDTKSLKKAKNICQKKYNKMQEE